MSPSHQFASAKSFAFIAFVLAGQAGLAWDDMLKNQCPSPGNLCVCQPKP